MNEIMTTSDGESITVTIRGTAVDNLRKAAETMNALAWCGQDNTAESVLRGFAVFQFEYWGAEWPHFKGFYLCDQLDNIADGIDTGFKEGTPEDTERREELRAALYKAFNVKELEITA